MDRCKHGLAVGTCTRCYGPKQLLEPGGRPRKREGTKTPTPPIASASYGTIWSDTELRASIEAYQRMLVAENRGLPLKKRDVIDDLVAETGRTPRSVQTRLMNISAVLNEKGAQWIPGFKPLAHVANRLRELVDHEYPSLGR